METKASPLQNKKRITRADGDNVKILKDQEGQKKQLIATLKTCLDILRGSEQITGEKALRNMSFLLILKLLEPRIGVEIDIEGFEYNFSHIAEENVEKYKKNLFEIIFFSKLSKVEEENITLYIRNLWDDILSVHPSTKNIFLKNKEFDIKQQTTYKKIINKLNEINLKNNHDILGDAYEEVIKDIMTGKVLGQFFTQPLVKKMMVKLIDPQIHADGKIETCGDPTMGTGGFLITYLQDILKKAKEKNIKPDWEFIRTKGLYGKELEPDTFQLAVSNMLISSGHLFNQLERGDSIREPITRKFDNIIANPPFGIKGLKDDNFMNALNKEYLPIKSDNAASLFLQAIIFMLKINGKCAIVLPDGKELIGKSNKTLIAIREYLMKTCDLKEVIYLPSGIFTHTNIKTCVLYFVKKKEGKDVLKIETKLKKYKFIETHVTDKIKFYEYEPTTDVKKLLIEAPIKEVRKNSYVLNYREYLIEEKNTHDGIMKPLDDLCKFEHGKQILKSNIKEGIYPVISGGKKPFEKKHNEYNTKENTILCARVGSAGYISKYDQKVWASQCFKIQSIDKKILDEEYLYYFLKSTHIQEKIFESKIGAAQPHIQIDAISKLKIPLLVLSEQKKLIKKLDKLSNEIVALHHQIDEHQDMLKL